MVSYHKNAEADTHQELKVSENYGTLTCFDDPDGAAPVGTIAFFPSLVNAERYRQQMKEANPHCEVRIFRYIEPLGTNH